MRPIQRQYLLWTLLPCVACAFLGEELARREGQALSAASTARIAALAGHLFTEEMGAKAGELALEAPVLTDSTLDSPILRAARRGDTLAALGSSSGTLTLSVALAEEEGESLRIRAITAPFPPRTPRLISSRTGGSVALYLRGQRIISTPKGFGPGELGELGDPVSLPPESILIPLASSGTPAAPAQLLVGSPERVGRETPFPLWIPILLAAIAFAGLVRLVPSRAASAESPVPSNLLVLNWLPPVLLWIVLLGIGAAVGREAEDLLRRDMVRVLAIMRDAELPLSPHALADLTGLRMIRGEEGRLLESTVQDSALVDRILALPLPPPTFPVLDRIQAGEGEITYAHMREGPGATLSLVAPSATGGMGRFRLLLAALGGVASLGSLLSLYRLRRRPWA
jgi:hypothetical protein